MKRVKRRAAPTLSASTLLQLMQLASPALPVGGFSYSETLEAAVNAGIVSDEASAQNCLLSQLHLSLSRARVNPENARRRDRREKSSVLHQHHLCS